SKATTLHQNLLILTLRKFSSKSHSFYGGITMKIEIGSDFMPFVDMDKLKNSFFSMGFSDCNISVREGGYEISFRGDDVFMSVDFDHIKSGILADMNSVTGGEDE
ncbi:hypothetical protein LOC54_06410, partial [Acetobacter sp. AN02]|uniref:hypothetical protein n=1 Tax=Acetobacter sp. AN02 TaxID=2894186 RepID=UPI0024342B77